MDGAEHRSIAIHICLIVFLASHHYECQLSQQALKIYHLIEEEPHQDKMLL